MIWILETFHANWEIERHRCNPSLESIAHPLAGASREHGGGDGTDFPLTYESGIELMSFVKE